MKKKKKKKKTQEGTLGGNILCRNFLGGNFPRGIHQGEFDGWGFPGWEIS